MSTRQALDGRAVIMMLTLCLIWGLQQSLLKLAAPDMAPILQIALRSGVAAMLVGLLMVWRKERLSLADGTLRPGLWVGGLFALEFLLVGQALQLTSASHVVVFVYTAPIFVALGLHSRLPAERLNLLQWAGIVLAFVGVMVAFFGRPDQPAVGEPMTLLAGDVLALLAGVAWAATTVTVRCSRLATASASLTLLYQLVGAFVLLLVAAVLMGQTQVNPTPLLWGTLLFQCLVVSFASFLVWFWLLRHYLASQLGVFSFLTPLFGVGFGVWLLGEPLETGFMLGAVLVLAGVVLVNSHNWLRK